MKTSGNVKVELPRKILEKTVSRFRTDKKISNAAWIKISEITNPLYKKLEEFGKGYDAIKVMVYSKWLAVVVNKGD